MKQARFISDYSPYTSLTITQTDDGDIVLKIRGDDEMRIATDGGKLHGEDLVRVCNAFNAIIETLSQTPNGHTEIDDGL